MKRVMIIVLVALSSSFGFAQTPNNSRDPNKDPHKPSSSITSSQNHKGNSEKIAKPANAPKPTNNKPGKGYVKPNAPHAHGHNRPAYGKPNYRPGAGKPIYRPMPPINVRPAPPAGRPVSYYELEDFLHYMNLQNFDNRKLNSAKSFVKSKALTAAQIAQISRGLSYDNNRLTFAKYAYRFCIDPGNYYAVEATLSYHHSKQELRAYVSQF